MVLVHLSSLDSYTQQATEAGDESLGELLADAMVEEILKHKGPVYIVDQGWSLGRRESRPRAKLIQAIQGRPVKWIYFDEDTDYWDDFEDDLVEKLHEDGVTKVAVGGIWYEDDLKSGCASETFVRLNEHFPARVIDRILGRESDFEELYES